MWPDEVVTTTQDGWHYEHAPGALIRGPCVIASFISLPSVDLEGMRFELGRRKFGAVVGDAAQVGCQSVLEPGCLLAPDTHAYPLSRIPRGAYGPHAILKNRPSLEAVPLERRVDAA
ncbi:udp-n-acetylglucosamine diphosphorylase [Chrysochromulina tobinii]|uniref:Udp-n-acetylglucosamine diphosphorylase n=1 Tax=Chrysochromulina tobinii TaxID=1460289 RepID=A0A0M0JWW2_9EUKA|nr:udp-n-acetylglucosamine diphosphorylase [Chrysochromulina tobinii]|eukprot:KOO30817.1 udp-n-acetylglucosamine diphosphorylase [Chrysochromulina sp. CCMP291]